MMHYYSCKTKQWIEIKNQEELEALVDSGVSLYPIHRIENGKARMMGYGNLLVMEDKEDMENMWNGPERKS